MGAFYLSREFLIKNCLQSNPKDLVIEKERSFPSGELEKINSLKKLITGTVKVMTTLSVFK